MLETKTGTTQLPRKGKIMKKEILILAMLTAAVTWGVCGQEVVKPAPAQAAPPSTQPAPPPINGYSGPAGTNMINNPYTNMINNPGTNMINNPGTNMLLNGSTPNTPPPAGQ